MSIWYLSFADENLPKGTQFLGAIQVRADNFDDALMQVAAINPGGQIAAWELSDDAPIPDEWLCRLLSRSELERLGELLTGDDVMLSTADLEVAESVSVFVCSDHNPR